MENNITEVRKWTRIFVYVFNIVSIFMPLAFLGLFGILMYISYRDDSDLLKGFKTYWWLLLCFVISLFSFYLSQNWINYMSSYIQLKNSRTETYRTIAFNRLKKSYFFVTKYALGWWLINQIDFLKEAKANIEIFTKEQQEWILKNNK